MNPWIVGCLVTFALASLVSTVICLSACRLPGIISQQEREAGRSWGVVVDDPRGVRPTPNTSDYYKRLDIIDDLEFAEE